jgi:hypothetical protein
VGAGAGREPVGTGPAGAEQAADGRRPDPWADAPAAAPGRLRRSMDDALGDDLAAARRRRRSMDDALGELGPGRLRRAGGPTDDADGGRDGWDDDPRSVRPHRSLDDALGGALGGRLRRVPDPADRDQVDRDKTDRDNTDRDKA